LSFKAVHLSAYVSDTITLINSSCQTTVSLFFFFKCVIWQCCQLPRLHSKVIKTKEWVWGVGRMMMIHTNLSTLTKTCFNYHLIHHKSHVDLTGIELGLCSDRVIANHLSHGMAIFFCLSVWCNKSFSELSSSALW